LGRLRDSTLQHLSLPRRRGCLRWLVQNPTHNSSRINVLPDFLTNFRSTLRPGGHDIKLFRFVNDTLGNKHGRVFGASNVLKLSLQTRVHSLSLPKWSALQYPTLQGRLLVFLRKRSHHAKKLIKDKH
jgi:hypothetical protein